MAIVYDFKKLPRTSGSDEEAARLYPQVVKLKTVTFKELAKEIEEATTYTVADLMGLMEAVVQAAAKHLNASEHVELEGLGTLSLSIACDKDEEGRQPVITSPDQVKPHHLHVSRVNFDAKPEFMKTLKGPFARAETPFPMNQERTIPTPDECRTLLLNHPFLLNQATKYDYKLSYWRERDDEVDFIIEHNKQCIAIEVKSGRRTSNNGLSVFREKFHPAYSLIVGSGGIPIDEFLAMDIGSLFGNTE